jgi:hypothetical protein
MATKSRGEITSGRARRVLRVGELATSVGSSYLWQVLRAPFRNADKRQQALLDTHIKNALRIVERSKELRASPPRFSTSSPRCSRPFRR